MGRYKLRREAVYYLGSEGRLGEGEWSAAEREHLFRLVERAAEFCGVSVVECAVLSRELHLLVQVDPQERVDDTELVRRYRVLYGEGPGFLTYSATRLEQILREEERAEVVRERLHRRMHDISMFMKTVKQRFTMWYNHRHGTKGSVWTDRFTSTVLEERSEVVAWFRAGIQSSPFRSGLAEDKESYRWSTAGRPRGRAADPKAEKLRKVTAKALEVLLATAVLPYAVPRNKETAFMEYFDFLTRSPVVGRKEFVQEHAREWRGMDTAREAVPGEFRSQLFVAHRFRGKPKEKGRSLG